jgi:hypothetical protein
MEDKYSLKRKFTEWRRGLAEKGEGPNEEATGPRAKSLVLLRNSKRCGLPSSSNNARVEVELMSGLR